jgi:hypothetical protein
MSSRRQPTRRVSQQGWKKHLAPVSGAVALVLMVVLVIVILVSGSNGDNDENGTAAEPEPTPTEVVAVTDPDERDEALTPESSDDEVEDELMPTPDATAEEDPEETPESEPTPAPTPTPEPLVGDFGELPSGDVPSGSPAEALNLEFQLDMSLQGIAREALVYQLERRQWTGNDVASLADRLDVDGEVLDQGNGSFRVEGSSSSIYISPALVQYIRPAASDEVPDLPDNEQLRQMVRSWLTETGLIGADIGPTEVLDRDPDSGRAFVLVKPVDPPDIISATPSAAVTIRGDGVVTEAMVNWPRSVQSSMYGLRSAENLWTDASRGRSFIEIDVNQLPTDFSGRNGTVTVTSSGIAYTLAGSPAGTQYLVPVVVFSGTANVEGADGPIPVRIFVEAVGAQASPRG